MKNADFKILEGFGDEWQAFDRWTPESEAQRRLFEEYFHIFPWEVLPRSAVGFDLGCGSGRWAQFVAPKVKTLHCIEASMNALGVAKRNLRSFENCIFHHASVESIPLEPASMDFGYSLGVLHHIPDTASGIRSCVDLLKPRAPFLLYLYYSFDNRPFWYRSVWRISDFVRILISRLPFRIRFLISQVIAALLYYPMARSALLFERLGVKVDAFPLSAYRQRNFYIMRNDALDRFGTRLESRFNRSQIADMMDRAGLANITFSEAAPFWCAVGFRKG